MFINYNGETIRGLTVKELYEMAIEKGLENAFIGIDFYYDDGDNEVEYVEEVHPADVEIGKYTTPTGEKITDCIWLRNHD